MLSLKHNPTFQRQLAKLWATLFVFLPIPAYGLTPQWMQPAMRSHVGDISADGHGNILISTFAFPDDGVGDRIQKLDPQGNVLWTHEPAEGERRQLFADPSGGYYRELGREIYRANSDGEELWSHTFDREYSDAQVAPIPDGSLYVTGWEFASRLSSEGNELWNTSFDDALFKALSLDGLGNAYATGWTLANLSDVDPDQGGLDAILTKFSKSGEILWTRQFGTDSADVGLGVAADALGNVFVLSEQYARNDDGLNETLDFHLSKYDQSGTAIWSMPLSIDPRHVVIRVGGVGLGERGSHVDLATIGDGSVFLAGYYSEEDLLSDPPPTTGFDSIVIEVDTDGNATTHRLGGEVDNVALLIDADELGNIFVGGLSSDDGGETTEGMVARFAIPEPSTNSLFMFGFLALAAGRQGLALRYKVANR